MVHINAKCNSVFTAFKPQLLQIILFGMTVATSFQSLALVPLDQCVTATEPPAVLGTERAKMKMFTGHYIHIGQRNISGYFNTVLQEIKPISQIKGIMRRYTWSDIETSAGVYNTAQISSDLSLAEANGKKLFIFVQYKYQNLANGASVPLYIRNKGTSYYYKIYDKSGNYLGTNPNWGNSYTLQRFLLMMKDLAVKFDGRPGLAGITANETSPSVSFSTDLARSSYSLGLIKMDKGAACLFRQTPFLQMTNHPVKYLPDMGNAYRANAIGIAAPDVFSQSPNDNMWESGYSYDYFAALEPFSPRAALVAEHNYYYQTYQNELKRENYKLEDPRDSVKRIFGIANEKLRSNFIFWHRTNGDDPYYNAVKNIVPTLPTLRSACPGNYSTNGCQY